MLRVLRCMHFIHLPLLLSSLCTWIYPLLAASNASVSNDRSISFFLRSIRSSFPLLFFLSFFFHTPVSAAFLNRIFLNFDFFTRLFFFFRILFFTLISFLCKIILDVSIFRFNFDFSFSFLLLSFSSSITSFDARSEKEAYSVEKLQSSVFKL